MSDQPGDFHAAPDPYLPPASEDGRRAGGGPVQYAVRPVDPRTKIPFGFGLTLIIAGSLMALGGIIGGLITMASSSLFGALGSLGKMMPSQEGAAVMEEMMKAMGPIYTIQGTMSIIQGCVSILALIAGIGLIGYKAWGRKFSMVWAGVAILQVVVATVVNFVYIVPATRRMMEGIMANAPGGSGGMNAALTSDIMGSVTGITQVFSAVLLLVFPVLTLIFLSKDRVKESCR